MDTNMKVLAGGALLMLGWLWYYLFIRQIFFNISVARPLIKAMNSVQEELIAPGAGRFTAVSTVSCLVICAIVAAIVLAFCPWYFMLCVFGGALVGLVMFFPQLKPSNRAMFDSFCTGYCRFVPDDELRQAMYEKKPSRIKTRLHDMGMEKTFVPDFK